MAYTPLIRGSGIFCLEEADWWLRPDDASTVIYLLEFLGQAPVRVPFRRGDVGTREELDFYLRKWRQRKYDRFKILYLAFHGKPGCIYCGDQRRGRVTLEDLGELLEGSCKVRVVLPGGLWNAPGRPATDRRLPMADEGIGRVWVRADRRLVA